MLVVVGGIVRKGIIGDRLCGESRRLVVELYPSTVQRAESGQQIV